MAKSRIVIRVDREGVIWYLVQKKKWFWWFCDWEYTGDVVRKKVYFSLEKARERVELNQQWDKADTKKKVKSKKNRKKNKHLQGKVVETFGE